MSKEVPQYQRTQSITPQTQVSGAQSAFTNLGTSKLQPTRETFIEKFSMELAQNAANQYAQQAGIEAAKTPGKTFLPIGESGRHFVESYKKEELQSLDFEANSYLQSIYGEASAVKNPSANTLMDYQQNALEGIEEFSNKISPESRNAFKRNLTETYQNGFSKLSKKVEQENFNRLKSQANMAYSQKTQLMTDAALSGERAEATRYSEEAIANLSSAEAQGYITPEESFRRKESLKKALIESTYSGEMISAAKENRGPEYLRGLVEDDTLNHLTPSEKIEAIESARATLSHYDAALSQSRYIQYNEAMTELEQGSLTAEKAEEYAEALGPKEASDLNRAISKMRIKEQEKTRKITAMSADLSNPLKMSRYKPEDIKEYTESLIAQQEQDLGIEPGSLPLSEQAKLVEGIKAPNPVIGDQINAGMASQDLNSIAQSSLVFARLEKNNPLSVSGVSKSNGDLARSIANAAANGMPLEKAISIKTENIQGVSAKDIEFRERAFQKSDDFKRYRDVDSWKSEAANLLGVGKKIVPDALAAQGYESFYANWISTGNITDARLATAAELKRIWAPTNINGKEEMMYSAPDLWMPNGEEFVKKQIKEVGQQLANDSKALYDKNERDWYYEIEEKGGERFDPISILEGSQKPESVGNKKLFIKKIFRDSNLTPKSGRLIISSDQYTSAPESGETPSYFLSMEGENGKYSPIFDVNTMQIKRYQLSDAEYQGKTKKEREGKVAREKEIVESRTPKRRQ